MMGGGGGNPNQSEPQMLPASESWVRVPAQCCALSYCLMPQGGAPAALTSHISVRAKGSLQPQLVEAEAEGEAAVPEQAHGLRCQRPCRPDSF